MTNNLETEPESTFHFLAVNCIKKSINGNQGLGHLNITNVLGNTPPNGEYSRLKKGQCLTGSKG